MSSMILTPLDELQSLSQSLFLSLSPPQSKPPPAPPLAAFLACDRALSSALTVAHTHQIKQRRIEALELEVLELEAQWREICMELESGKRELEEMIKEGGNRVRAIDEAKKGESAALVSSESVVYRFLQHQSHTPNYWPMHKA